MVDFLHIGFDVARLRDLASVHVRYGYRRLHALLRREGWQVNHKLVQRLYQEEGLQVRTKSRKKQVTRPRLVRPEPTQPTQHWSMDFVLGSARRRPPFSLPER